MTRTRTGASPGLWRTRAEPELSPILQAALDAFYENGYHGTSVRDVARRAGLTVPALYYHHTNKESILAALLDQSITAVIDRCRAALDEAGPAPRDRFEYLVEALVLYMAYATKNAAMDAEIRALGDEHRRGYSTKRRTVESMLTSVIKDGAEQGVFTVSSPRDTGRALLGMIQAIALWYRPDGRLAPQAVARSYVDIALHTVGAA